MTGTRGSHFDRKKEAASLQRSTFKCRNRHWRVEGFGVYSAPAYKAIIDGTVESIPPAFYCVLYHKSHFFARFFSKSGSFCTRLRLGSYALTFPRAPEFRQLRNSRRRCTFCPFFLWLNSQKCPYFQLFGNEMDQIPQLICSLPFAFPVWKKHPKCAIIKAKKFVQSGDTHVNNPRLKSRACSGKSVL